MSIIRLKVSFKFTLFSLVLISFFLICFKIKNHNIGSFSLANKAKVVKYIGKVTENKKFNLSYSVPAGQNSGFSYLLYFYKVIPSNGFNDPLIQIIIPSQNKYKSFGDISIDFPFPFNQ